MNRFEHIDRVESLPAGWDELAISYFQKKEFLLYCQQYNPCRQRYYLYYKDDVLQAVAIVYSLNLDLLTFTSLKLPIPANIAGVPVSISPPGIFGEPTAVEILKDHICKEERGFTLFLNLVNKPVNKKRASGTTLPAIVMLNRFKSWEHYIECLRAPYRRRLNKINNSRHKLRFTRMSCNNFTDGMYLLYLQVYRRSNDKLEKLEWEFFKNLDDRYTLTTCTLEDILLGWNISLRDGEDVYFFMGGIDYNWNKSHNIYFLLLSDLVKNGIENKAQRIHLGQTAEIPKMRLGGVVSKRYMEAHHSNFILNSILKAAAPMLGYRKKLEHGKIFVDD